MTASLAIELMLLLSLLTTILSYSDRLWCRLHLQAWRKFTLMMEQQLKQMRLLWQLPSSIMLRNTASKMCQICACLALTMPTMATLLVHFHAVMREWTFKVSPLSTGLAHPSLRWNTLWLSMRKRTALRRTAALRKFAKSSRQEETKRRMLLL